LIHCGLILSLFTGCSVPFRGDKTIQEPIPPSHVQIEEKVLELAIDNLGLPDGNGMEVQFDVTGNDQASVLLSICALEYLLRNDYHVVEKGTSVPKITFTVDSLQLTLTPGHSRKKGKLIFRDAFAQIGAALFEIDGTRHVYKGYGTFKDVFAFQMIDSLDRFDPYVDESFPNDRFTERLKPILIGVTMTVLAWMLYSYRG